MTDDTLRTIILDVRPEADYNLFHLQEGEHAPPRRCRTCWKSCAPRRRTASWWSSATTICGATEAWKFLRAESVRSAYILEGGLNNWLRTFGERGLVTDNALVARPTTAGVRVSGRAGAKYPFAAPNETLARSFTFTPKIVLEVKRGPGGGGCG